MNRPVVCINGNILLEVQQVDKRREAITFDAKDNMGLYDGVFHRVNLDHPVRISVVDMPIADIFHAYVKFYGSHRAYAELKKIGICN